jgi:L-fuconolactonase
MLLIDAHCHAAPFYYEPIESALDSMLRSGVEKALLIPLAIVDSLNPYLIECLRRFPGRFSVVATVDPQMPGAPEQLEEWAKQGAEGVRLSPTDSLSIWRKAAELGLVVSLRRRVEDTISDDFRNIVESLPDLKIVLEHLGCRREDAAPPYKTFRRVLDLAQYPNVLMKVPGLGEICQRPASFPQPFDPFENIPPVIEMAIESFGAQRLMWGSDFPHVAEREGYGNCLRLLMEHVVKRDEDRDWIFGKTAATLFRFGESS